MSVHPNSIHYRQKKRLLLAFAFALGMPFPCGLRAFGQSAPNPRPQEASVTAHWPTLPDLPQPPLPPSADIHGDPNGTPAPGKILFVAPDTPAPKPAGNPACPAAPAAGNPASPACPAAPAASTASAAGGTTPAAPRDPKAAPGTRANPLSLYEAREVIRRIKAKGLPPGGVDIRLLGGNYSLSEAGPLSFTEADSGEAGKPIVFQPASDETVTLTASVCIDGGAFRSVSNPDILNRLPKAARGKVMECNLHDWGIKTVAPLSKKGFNWPELPPAFSLIIDDDAFWPARYPNQGWLHAATVEKRGYVPRETGMHQPTDFLLRQEGPVWTLFNPHLRQHHDRLTAEADPWCAGYFCHAYADDSLRIRQVEKVGCRLRFTAAHPAFYGMGGGDPPKFYFYNLLCELDAPGEYYLDRETLCLYCFPKHPLRFSTVRIVLSAQPLVRFSNASHIMLKGLHFSAANGNAVEIDRSHEITLAGCRFSDIGQKGVVLNGTSETHHNRIIGCDFTRLGSGGILLNGGERLSLTPGNNCVVNCRLTDYATRKRTYAPAVSVNGCGNRVLRNEISHAPHQAIAFSGNNHQIEGNHIFNVLTETGDSGAIYSCARDWTSRGTHIRNNWFHDIPEQGGGGTYCIYLDDMTCGTVCECNLFTRLQANAFLVGGGRDNVISNNIECNAGRGFLWYDERCLGWAHASAHIPDGGNYAAFRKQLEELEQPGNAACLQRWKEHYPGMFDPEMTAARPCPKCGRPQSMGAVPKRAVIQNNIVVGGASVFLSESVSAYGRVSGNRFFPLGTDIGFSKRQPCPYAVQPRSLIQRLQGEKHFNAHAVGLFPDAYRPTVDPQPPKKGN